MISSCLLILRRDLICTQVAMDSAHPTECYLGTWLGATLAFVIAVLKCLIA